MNQDAQHGEKGFDIIINGVARLYAELEVSAVASAGFHKENNPNDTVQIRARGGQELRTILGYAQLE